MSFEHLMGMVGVVVPIASVVVSALNHYVRDMQAKGEAIPAWLLHVIGMLNVAAMNGDKALQMIKLAQSLKEAPKAEEPK